MPVSLVPLLAKAEHCTKTFLQDQMCFLAQTLPLYMAARTDVQREIYFRIVIKLFVERFPLSGPGPFHCYRTGQLKEAEQALQPVSPVIRFLQHSIIQQAIHAELIHMIWLLPRDLMILDGICHRRPVQDLINPGSDENVHDLKALLWLDEMGVDIVAIGNMHLPGFVFSLAEMIHKIKGTERKSDVV